MLNFHNDKSLLVETETVNATMNWHSTDSLERYNNQSTKFKNQHNYEIIYKFNSLSYRTKEIEDLDKDFLLTFGCSYTEGIGLNAEDIWNNDVSKNIGLDLYNCAKQATGFDVQYYNATLWKNSNLPIPKLVIVQWPQKARKQFGFQRSDSIELQDMSLTPTRDGIWWGRRYIMDTGEMHLNNFMWFENFNNIWESLNVPVLNFTWDNDLDEVLNRSNYKIWHIIPGIYDKSRDNSHDGAQFHRSTAEQLLEILKLSNFTYKV